MKNQRVVIIGGTSGIGLATAKLALELGASLIIAGRSNANIERATKLFKGQNVTIHQLNNQSEGEIEAFFRQVSYFDHLFTPGAAYTRGPITASLDVAKSCFEGKFWPQYMAVKSALPYINKNGSIVLMSGAFSQRPPNDGASYAACNAAIESLGKALATELAPIRVNVIAPGTIRTEFVWEGRGVDEREDAYREYEKLCLLNKVGKPEDIAQAVVYLLQNQYTTGSTLYPDGGFTLR